MFSLSMFVATEKHPDVSHLRNPNFRFLYGFNGFSLSHYDDNYWRWLKIKGRWPFLR